MVSCSEENQSGKTDIKELVAKVKEFSKDGALDPKKEDELLVKTFQWFVEKIKDKYPVWKNGIFVFVDPNKNILDIVPGFDMPNFLQKNEIEYFEASAPIFDQKHNHIGFLGFIFDVIYKDDINNHIDGLIKCFEFSLESYQKIYFLEKQAEKREALLKITDTAYSSFDLNNVLAESIESINFLYPDDKLDFWMTQDDLIYDLPIKLIDIIPDKNDINGQAFLEGKLIVNRRGTNELEMAAPIKGKQGIYGVINLSSPESLNESPEKINLIYSIANIIGNALENVKSYKDSIDLVNELQVINDLTKHLNQSLNKESILQVVISELIKLFGSKQVSVVQINEDRTALNIVAASNPENVGKNLLINSGYIGYVYKNKESIIVADIDLDKGISDLYFENIGCKSLISVPIIGHRGIVGVLTIYCEQSHQFSYDDLKMLNLFSQHLGLSLTNASLHGKIQKMAVTDYLTGLYNRSYLDEKIHESQEDDNEGSFLLFDLDNFKQVNDTYGHQIGDEVLVQVANILKDSIRKHDIATRWGGEELAVYLPNVATDSAVQIAERITEKVRSNTEPHVTISCGVSTWRKKDLDISSSMLFRNADKALYDAKDHGKDQVRIFK